MRKIKKNKKNKFIIIGITYFMILLTISIAYSFFNVNLSINATVRTSTEQDYAVETILTNKWDGNGKYNYHFTPTLIYKGNNQITAWRLYIEIPYDTEIIGCYSAKCKIEGETLIIENDTYNGTLSPESNSTTFGIQVSTSTSDYDFHVLGAKFYKKGTTEIEYQENISNHIRDITDEEVTTEDQDYINATFKSTGGWNTTTTYILKVENTSDTEEIVSWNLDIQFPENSQLESCWGGSYTYDEQTGILSLTSPEWVPTLKPNSSIEINIYMNTYQEIPYQPVLGKFIGLNTNDKKIEKEITIGE